MTDQPTILLAGGAGFVGQNLLTLLHARGYQRVIVLDKNHEAIEQLKTRYSAYTMVHADLSASPDTWKQHFSGVGTLIMLQAQIGGHGEDIFIRNNITSTRHILDAVKEHAVAHTVHISSSVVTQKHDDTYSRTKREQESMVTGSSISCTVLRPTLMFGKFNVNHFAWLARLMRVLHVMPVPGNGRYIRQPLYVDDFCQVILRCIEAPPRQAIFNISGLEQIFYIDCLRKIRHAMRIFCPIICIPYPLFKLLIKAWAMLHKNATFNTEQLQALCAGDIFETIDWPGIFHVTPTPLDTAMHATFSSFPD